ncbi:hypothetical protein PENTCL1PPCAC_8968 [Pristionchus entomophagus]|uniref:BTB domain-containing protein n=1 Tax=Pristionchus entomophagus TaxID=358040 RepID=A0AAV5SUJ7_9BILA|nr:hypothetical protein PENTCL1PPCAC_8968 [Pristionchus entomophagus]
MYPPSKEITDANVECLLKLGDRFDIDWLLYKCEEYLISSSKLDLTNKIALVSLYRLVKLQDYSIDKLNTIKDVKNLKNSAIYEAFPDAITTALHHKIMDLIAEGVTK